LINEGTGASGASTVHPLINGSSRIEKGYFGILSTQFYGYIALRQVFFNSLGTSNDFLNKISLQNFRG
jgi:hypothetical protein